MKKLTRREKQEEEDNLWTLDLMCKIAVLLISCVLIIPALLLIGEWFADKKSSLLHNIINGK